MSPVLRIGESLEKGILLTPLKISRTAIRRGKIQTHTFIGHGNRTEFTVENYEAICKDFRGCDTSSAALGKCLTTHKFLKIAASHRCRCDRSGCANQAANERSNQSVSRSGSEHANALLERVANGWKKFGNAYGT